MRRYHRLFFALGLFNAVLWTGAGLMLAQTEPVPEPTPEVGVLDLAELTDADGAPLQAVEGAMQSNQVIVDFAVEASGLLDGARLTASGLRVEADGDSGSYISAPVEVPLRDIAPALQVGSIWSVAGDSFDQTNIKVDFRASPDGTAWGEWLTHDHFHLNAEGDLYSHLLAFDPATRYVQFRIRWQGEALSERVTFEQVRLAFISPGSTPSETRSRIEALGAGGVVRGTADPVPEVVSRTSWGCPDGQGSRWEPDYADVTHLIVHHTATSNSSTDWPATVRAIWQYHAVNNNWGDIGYNYLIDPNGVIYEGRAGGDGAIGAHFSCLNANTMGVSMLGNFSNQLPTSAALRSLETLLAYKSAYWGLDPVGTSYHAPSRLTLPSVAGHRDGNDATRGCPSGTVCPGTSLYNIMPSVRESVADTTVDITPGVPTVVAPAADAVLDLPFDVVLEPGAFNYTGEADYLVQLDDDPDFNSVDYDSVEALGGWSSSATITVDAELPDGTYYLRVRQGDTERLGSEWTPARTIVINDVPTCDASIADGDTRALVAAFYTANNSTDETMICLAQNGTYTLTQSVDGSNGLPEVTSPVLLVGSGATLRRSSSAAEFRLLAVDQSGSLSISGLTLANGARPYTPGQAGGTEFGGAILNAGQLVLDDVTFSGSQAHAGGAIFSSGPLDGQSVTFIGNRANDGGALANFYGPLTLNGAIFSENEAVRGGAFHTLSSTVQISGAVFSENSAQEAGGALYIDAPSDQQVGGVTIIGSLLQDNQAAAGGAIHLLHGSLDVQGSVLALNTATGPGSAVSAGGTASASETCIAFNSGEAVSNTGSESVDFGGNWWGAADGPSGAGPGRGDSVGAGINYSDYLTVAPAFCDWLGARDQLTLLSPTGTIHDIDGDPVYRWTQVPDATAYRIMVNRADGSRVFYQLLAADQHCDGATCFFQGVPVNAAYRLENGTYTLTLNAVTNGTNGPTMGPFTFTLDAAPPASVELGAVTGAGTLTPQIEWTLPGTAVHSTRFRVYVAPSADLMSPVLDAVYTRDEVCGEALTCRLTLSDIVTPAAYNVYVQSQGPGGGGTWAGPASLDFAPQIPQAPRGVVVEVVSGSPVITWEDDQVALWFELFILGAQNETLYNDWHPRADAVCDGSTCMLSPPVYPSNGSYTLYIRAWGPAGFSTGGYQNTGWTGPAVFNVVGAAPGVVSGLSVTEVDSGRPAFTWTAAPEATWYRLWIGTAADEATRFEGWAHTGSLGCTAPDPCTFRPEVDLSNGGYVWSITPWGPGGMGAESALGSFNVNAPAAGTAIPSLPRGVQLINPSAFTWNHVPGVAWYQVWIGTAAELEQRHMGWYRAETLGCTVSSACTLTLEGLALANGDYTWYIQTYTPAGLGPWSAGQPFSVRVP